MCITGTLGVDNGAEWREYTLKAAYCTRLNFDRRNRAEQLAERVSPALLYIYHHTGDIRRAVRSAGNL